MLQPESCAAKGRPEGIDHERDESNLTPMRTFQHSILSAMLFGPTLLLGCATGTTTLEMSRIAGFVSASPGKLYVEHIGGEDSSAFRDQLYKAFSDDGRLATEGYGIIPPEMPESAANTPTLILSGTYSTDKDTRHFTEGSGENEKKYKETTEIHEFRYLIRDAFTGEELDANVARYDDVTKEEDRGESFLGAIIGDAIKGALENLVGIESGYRERLARIFATSLHLHQEKRIVGLLQDKDIPELEEGIEFVRKGNWTAAIAKFQAGAENHPNARFCTRHISISGLHSSTTTNSTRHSRVFDLPTSLLPGSSTPRRSTTASGSPASIAGKRGTGARIMRVKGRIVRVQEAAAGQ